MRFETCENRATDEMWVRVEHMGGHKPLYAAAIPVTGSLLAWQLKGGITAMESIGVLMEGCVERVWAEVQCGEEAEEEPRFAKGGWIEAGTMSEEGIMTVLRGEAV